MKVVIDLKFLKELENDDILIFRDGSWVNIRKSEYIAELNKKIKSLEKEVDTLNKNMTYCVDAIKELRGED